MTSFRRVVVMSIFKIKITKKIVNIYILGNHELNEVLMGC